MLRFGMFDQLENTGGSPLHQLYRDRLDLLRRCEDAGFWGWHKSEHHLIPLDAAPSINVFLAAAIEATSRIRICSLVHLLPFYHPVRLAEELCMLDQLSEGRLEVGFGKGVSRPEHILWGLEPDDGPDVTEETLELLVAMFTAEEDVLDFEGRFHQFRDVPIELRPFQKPFPPLWRPGTLDVAADLGVRTVAGGPIAMVAEAADRYRQRFNSSGIGACHSPMIGGVRRFVVAPTDAEAEALGRRTWAAFTHNLSLLYPRYGLTPPNDPSFGGDFDKARAVEAVVVGSPQRVRDHIAEFEAEANTDYLIGCFAWGDLTAAEYLRSFDLFVEHCMPPTTVTAA